MSDHNPPPLPEKLQNWHHIEEEDFRKPWEHFRPFFTSLGYSLFDTPEYHSDPVGQLLPTKPARDPFHPTDEEAFVYNAHNRYFKPGAFFQRTPTGYLALDRYRRSVYIKAIPRSSNEWETIQYLSTVPLRADIRNHTIPNVTIIPAGEWIFVVQAYWGGHWNIPPFDTVTSRLEMSRQVLEGLAFMHEHGIGHGDIHPDNIVWNHDGTRKPNCCMRPGRPVDPFHSTFDFRLAFIDFGCSARFHSTDMCHLIEPDQIPPSPFAAPEQSRMGEPYDIFASDVYNLGKVLQNDLEEATKGNPAALSIPAVAPDYIELLKQMTREGPSERLSSSEALKSLDVITKALSDNTVA